MKLFSIQQHQIERAKWLLLWKWRGTTSDKVLYRADIPEGALIAIPAHYVHCLICGDSYHWKAAHYIGFTHACPYCQECHEKGSRRKKVGAMWKLVKEWHETSPDDLWTYRGSWGYVRVFLLSVLGIVIGE